MPKTWVIADTHFGHNNIIHYENRPFKDKHEMNEKLIENWNSVVAPDDVVYHLGDVIFGGTQALEAILPRLNGYKILRKGNHDYRFSDRKLLKYFDEVYSDDILLDDLCLSHYPLDDEEMAKLMYLGLIKGNVHGHVHSKIDNLDQSKYFCVSVELTDYRPLDFEVVKKHFGIES